MHLLTTLSSFRQRGCRTKLFLVAFLLGAAAYGEADNPAPALTAIAPSGVGAGSAATAITVTGTGFVLSSVVRVNNTDAATTFVSANQLTAVITAGNLSNTSILSITVFTPGPGGGVSGAAAFIVLALTPPTVTSISPSAGAQGTTFSATINGANLAGATAVTFSGTSVTAVILPGGTPSSLPLTVTIAAGAALGNRTFTVTAPAGTSGANPAVFLSIVGTGGTWVSTGNMTEFRTSPTATLLGSGRVLVAGGRGDPRQLSTAEVFDPNTRTWTSTGSMAVARDGHTATLLSNGKVLVAGGGISGVRTASAELYDPTTGMWTTTGFMNVARQGHSATLLANGKVLVAGGCVGLKNCEPTVTSELYDPNSGTWMMTGSLVYAATGQSVMLVATGKVFLVLGQNGQLYDPASGTWTLTAQGPLGVWNPAVLLPDGRVFLQGGASYDPVSDTWATTAPLAAGRGAYAMTALRSGRVLVAGGVVSGAATLNVLKTTELYDPGTGVWTPAAPMNVGRYQNPATLLPDGKILIAGEGSAETYEESGAAPNPIPVLSSIGPTNAVAGQGQVGVFLSGTGFLPNSTVKSGNTRLVTTYLGANKLVAVLPPDFLSVTGTFQISVVNPAPGGGESGSRTFSVTGAPLASIMSISPAKGRPGTTFSATLTGTDLAGSTSVTFSGTGVTATIQGSVTSTTVPLTVTVAPDAAVGSRTLTVTTPAGTSAPFSSFVVGATPVISDLGANPPGLSQAVAPVSGQAFSLTISGQNFVSASQVLLNDVPLTTTFANEARLTATVPASALVAPGSSSMKVSSPGSLNSNALTLRVVERGDINGNRSVNIGDALATALSVAGITRPPLPNTVGDVNLNGETNIGDALVIALFSGRLIPNFAGPNVYSPNPSVARRGESLTLQGSGLPASLADLQLAYSAAGDRVVRLPLLGASGAVVESTTLAITVPQDAVSGPIQIIRLDVPMGGQEFPLLIEGTPTPLSLTSVTPFYRLNRGDSITLAGTGFDSTPGNNIVRFRASSGTVEAPAATSTSKALTVTVPDGAICGEVAVRVGSQTSNARSVLVSGTTCPVLLADVLGGANPGEVLVLEGTGFDVATPANNIVRFSAVGGTATATVLQAGATQIHVRVPDTAIEGNVTVTVGSETSNPLPYRLTVSTNPASIDVAVSSSVAVGAYQATITFNQNIVRLEAANVRGGNGAGFSSPPAAVNIDNANGIATINAFQVGNSPAGTFTVANLVFTPVAAGSSPVVLRSSVLTDTLGNNLLQNNAQISLSSASVTVNRPP